MPETEKWPDYPASSFPESRTLSRSAATGASAPYFEDGDYALYLDLLADASRSAGVEIWSCCLMPNHVHIIAVPSDEDGLRRVFRYVHRHYTGYVNARLRTAGHLWQARFGPVAMDEAHRRWDGWGILQLFRTRPSMKPSLTRPPAKRSVSAGLSAPCNGSRIWKQRQAARSNRRSEGLDRRILRDCCTCHRNTHIRSDMNRITTDHPSFVQEGVMNQAAAAAYNFGAGDFSGDVSKIDEGTTGGDYGSSVVGIMRCF